MSRAPVLVAIAMVERGIDAISAVTLIRSKRYVASKTVSYFFSDDLSLLVFICVSRRGAINAVQLSYLESYKPERVSKKKCSIM